MADQDDDIDLAEAELDDLFDDEYSSAELVPIEVDTEEVLSDPRRSDVDRWGRSERTRQWARRLYDRLGFHATGEADPHVRMRHEGGTAGARPR